MHAMGSEAPSEARVVRLAPGCNPARLPLSPAEGYLLSRIDGATPWRLLREIGGLTPEDVDRCLERWIDQGILLVADGAPGPNGAKRSAPPASPRPAEPPAAAAPAPAALASRPEEAIDASLEIPVEAQRRILAFEAKLDRPYHEILGVAKDADARTVKRAYFELSKEYHPDRYFRKRVGRHGERLERIFRKVLEAYELLADPTTRAEVQRSLDAAAAAPPAAPPSPPTPLSVVARPSPPAAPASSAPPAPPTAPRPRAPRISTAHLRALAQRKAKAKTFFEAGMAAFQASRWLEAASSVRLALAFDPWNAAYKESFAGVQRRANDERAKQFVKEAESALELRQPKEALRLYEEALHCVPHEPEINYKAARLALVLGEDPKRAKEYAARACELRPEVPAHHRLLGQIYKSGGLVANARRELEAALRLDPRDAEARQELKTLGRG